MKADILTCILDTALVTERRYRKRVADMQTLWWSQLITKQMLTKQQLLHEKCFLSKQNRHKIPWVGRRASMSITFAVVELSIEELAVSDVLDSSVDNKLEGSSASP